MKAIYSYVAVVLISCPTLRTLVSGEFEITVPREPQMAVYGQSLVLPCNFPVGPGTWDVDSLIVTWQRGLEVVHSFYRNQDQLDRQSHHYVNRTQLYLSQLLQGNASLRLDYITPEDAGYYSCSVSTLLGIQKKTFLVEFAAFYTEPHLQLTVSRSGVELLLTSQGYPHATLEWRDQEGQDITNKTVTETQVDLRGLYTLSSRVTQGPGANISLMFILRNQLLNQEMRRELTVFTENELVSLDNQRWRLPLYISLVLFTMLLLATYCWTSNKNEHTALQA